MTKMNVIKKCAVSALCAILVVALGRSAQALTDVTTPGDPIIITGGSSPGGETVDNSIDNTSATKYLNFTVGEGLIVTPSLGSSTGGTVVFGLGLTTANDSPGRDPTSFTLEGSTTGMGGPFTFIAGGLLAPPGPRFTDYPDVFFPNSTAYTTYRLKFPTVNGDGIMQIAEVRLIGELVVPEPSTLMLIGLGGLGILGWVRRQRRS